MGFRLIQAKGLVPTLSLSSYVKLGSDTRLCGGCLFICEMGLISFVLGTGRTSIMHVKGMAHCVACVEL